MYRGALLNIVSFIKRLLSLDSQLVIVYRENHHAGCTANEQGLYQNEFNWHENAARNEDIRCLLQLHFGNTTDSRVRLLPVYDMSHLRALDAHPRVRGLGHDCQHFCNFEINSVPSTWNRLLSTLLVSLSPPRTQSSAVGAGSNVGDVPAAGAFAVGSDAGGKDKKEEGEEHATCW